MSRLDKFEKAGFTITYPDWKMKAVALSYDDGNIADRRLVKIFNKYGLKGTFHLPSTRIVSCETAVNEDEIKTLYAGHEISAHGANHINLAEAETEVVKKEIADDCSEWRRILGHDVIGYSYPYGAYSDMVIDVLHENNLCYSRTVENVEKFDLPDDFMKWHPHTHHNGNIALWCEKYLTFEPQKLSVLLVWGHSYEFDRQNNWEIIEEFCSAIAGHEDIYYAGMGDIAIYAKALEQVEISSDGKNLINNSDTSIYFIIDGERKTVAPSR